MAPAAPFGMCGCRTDAGDKEHKQHNGECAFHFDHEQPRTAWPMGMCNNAG